MIFPRLYCPTLCDVIYVRSLKGSPTRTYRSESSPKNALINVLNHANKFAIFNLLKFKFLDLKK